MNHQPLPSAPPFAPMIKLNIKPHPPTAFYGMVSYALAQAHAISIILFVLTPAELNPHPNPLALPFASNFPPALTSANNLDQDRDRETDCKIRTASVAIAIMTITIAIMNHATVLNETASTTAMTLVAMTATTIDAASQMTVAETATSGTTASILESRATTAGHSPQDITRPIGDQALLQPTDGEDPLLLHRDPTFDGVGATLRITSASALTFCCPRPLNLPTPNRHGQAVS